MRAWIAACAALVSAGCVSRPALVLQSFTIDPPAARSGPSSGPAVELGQVRVEAAYAGAALVYRVGPHRVEKDPYARFVSPPAGLLTGAIRGYLDNADFVGDVVSPGTGLPVAARIEADALDLAGDFEGDPAAALTLRFRVARPGAAGEVLTRTYARHVSIPQKTAAAVVAGWNEALGQIMAEFETDLRAVLATP